MHKLKTFQWPSMAPGTQISLEAYAESRELIVPEVQERPTSLPAYDLLNNFAQLARLLKHELHHGSRLNSYLLAVGMYQIVEDYLHADPYLLFTAEKYLARIRWPIGVIAAKSARLTGASVLRTRRLRAKTRRLLEWRADLAAFVQQLADTVAIPVSETNTPCSELVETGEALLASIKHLPLDLLQKVVRLPACFRSFDQQPADLDCVVSDFAARWPDSNRPLAVLGIRTSGSYLAPLYAAFLKAHGYHDVRALTLRPGRGISKSESQVLQTVIRRNGLVLVADDPPVTGKSYQAAVKALEHAGVRPASVVLLVPLFGSRDTLPPLLQKYAAVILEWKEWAIHKQLTPAAIKQTMADLLGTALEIGDVSPLPSPARASTRGHIRASYQLQLFDSDRGHSWQQEVVVKGVGLGYFGEYSLAVAQRIRAFMPMIFGLRAGLLYCAVPPADHQICSIEPDQEAAVASAMVTYVVARHRALAVPEDASLGQFGQRPVWEQASELMSVAFGRAGLAARVAVLDPLTKRLLRVERPSVIDGDMDLSRWFAGKAPSDPLIKTEFDERAFSNVELYCYDSVYDLAGLAMTCQSRQWAKQLRDHYEQLTAHTISAERWMIYLLVHLWDRQRRVPNERVQVQRTCASALQSFFAETYFAGLVPNASGNICAIDIDGVLETETLGFSGLTPTSALALRALLRHGYRPILATGRSLNEVRERCEAYRLAGGVAEYGAVIYNHLTGRVRELLTEVGHADLDRVRVILSQIQDVYIDSGYQYAVRAYCLDASGRMQGLSPELISTVLERAKTCNAVRPIPGESQTDFMVAGIDKGVGLRALSSDLDLVEQATPRKPLGLAVGDTVSDLPMFELAALAFAPANADRSVKRAGIRVLRQPYQPGFAAAVSTLLGHWPGKCDVCRSQSFSSDTQLFLTLLAARETGKLDMVWHAILLGLKARRP